MRRQRERTDVQSAEMDKLRGSRERRSRERTRWQGSGSLNWIARSRSFSGMLKGRDGCPIEKMKMGVNSHKPRNSWVQGQKSSPGHGNPSYQLQTFYSRQRCWTPAATLTRTCSESSSDNLAEEWEKLMSSQSTANSPCPESRRRRFLPVACSYLVRRAY
jgi:hypothetical protein